MQRRCSQERFEVIGRGDQREQIAAKNHEADRSRFATPGSSIGSDPFGGSGALRGQGEGGQIEINADQLPFAEVESGQDATCPAADLQDGTS